MVGVINSVVSVYYYMNIARRMFFAESKDVSAVETDIFTTGVIFITSAATLLMGILPQTFMRIVKDCIGFHS